MKSHLSIHGLELLVYLGWSEEERLLQQAVFVDIDIGLPQPPKACVSDELKDTFCYATLIEHLRQHLTDKRFRLIEYLSREIYQTIKVKLPFPTLINVQVTKHPPLSGLTGGVCFNYGDENQ